MGTCLDTPDLQRTVVMLSVFPQQADLWVVMGCYANGQALPCMT